MRPRGRNKGPLATRGEAALSASDDATETQLRRTIDELDRILASVSDYLWSADFGPGGEVTYRYYSPVVERITGRPREFFEAGPQRWLSTVDPRDRERVQQSISRLTSGRMDALVEEYRIRLPDGSLRWVRDSVTARALEHDRLRVDGVVTDITDGKLAEELRERLEGRTRHVEKLESLGILAGGIAHDFNNMLTGILGNAALAALELPPESPVREYVAQIEKAGEGAAALCRQMLAYSGKGRFTVIAVDLSRLVEETTDMLAMSISKNVSLVLELEEHLPAIDADPSQIQQIVMNLITNASESLGDAASGEVTVKTGTMVCDQDYLNDTYLQEELPSGVYVFLEVTDSGRGMDAATRDRIFDPFFTTKFAGRGLGLAATLGIVRGHRGAIEVSSELGQGSQFKVLLPASDARVEDPILEARGFSDDWRGRGLVLVVDDEDAVRTMARNSLRLFGFDVLAVEDGRSAGEMYREHADEIVAVVLDLTMPHVSGEEVFRELHRIQSDVRVILSSGFNEQTAVARFVGSGLAGFIQKPYKPLELVAKVRAVLENS